MKIYNLEFIILICITLSAIDDIELGSQGSQESLEEESGLKRHSSQTSLLRYSSQTSLNDSPSKKVGIAIIIYWSVQLAYFACSQCHI